MALVQSGATALLPVPHASPSAPAPFLFDGRPVRVLDHAGDPWFVAGDVARELGYSHTPHMLRLLDDDEKGVHETDTLGGKQSVSIISEPGLYKAVARSAKVGAKVFDRWVRHDVLPAIRKTGTYGTTTAPPNFGVPGTFAAALRLAADQAEVIAQRENEIAVMVPKVVFHDAVADAVNTQDMNTVAKVLGTGRTRLFARLRRQSILMGNNRPYQKYVDADYFRVIELRPWKDAGGKSQAAYKTVVTGKGLIFLQRLLAEAAPPKGES
jgi:prophage antirepressor-like protein